MIKGGNIPTMHNESSIGKSSKENNALHMDDDKHNHWTQYFLQMTFQYWNHISKFNSRESICIHIVELLS